MTRSYSQAGQDRFARFILNQQISSPSFLELGAADPSYISNTRGLEEEGWHGLSIDNDGRFATQWNQQRRTPLILADVTSLNWSDVIHRYPDVFAFENEKYKVDYLSFDVDDATNETMIRFPWDTIRFRCATVEHDMYRQGTGSMNLIRQILEGAGYTRVFSNVSVPYSVGAAPFLLVNANHTVSFEDWWVDLNLLPPDHPLFSHPLFRSEGELWSTIVQSF